MFTGYTEQTVEFLWSLRLNNNKEWFLAHKAEYETLVKQPTVALANALFEHLREKYPKYDWKLHISRIYRDARRLYGRGPMNDHLWFVIFTDKAVHPAFYFSFQPDNYHFGMGCWSEGNVLMQRFRRQVQLDPAPAERLARKFARQKTFVLYGEPYKRPKFSATPLLNDWVNRREIGFHCERMHGEWSFGAQLYDTVREGFDFLMPYYKYFSTLPELEEQEERTPS